MEVQSWSNIEETALFTETSKEIKEDGNMEVPSWSNVDNTATSGEKMSKEITDDGTVIANNIGDTNENRRIEVQS